MTKLGDTIRDLRKSMGYTLKDVSQGIDEKIDYLGKVERGERTPTAGFVRKLQKFYTVQDNSLLHIYYSDRVLELLEYEEIDKGKLLNFIQKRLENPDYQIPIERKEQPAFNQNPPERKIKYFKEYTRNQQLTPKVRNILLTKGKSIMQEGGSDLDDSLSDEELIDRWNEWVTTEGYRSEETRDWYEDYQSKILEEEQQKELEKQKKLKELGLLEEDSKNPGSDKVDGLFDSNKGIGKWT
jgi:transcriptional regulator with XRE-family HTH domain